MPIYEYQCESCGSHIEVKQSIKDAPLTTCERCGQSLRRLISSPGILFKGSGWYVTDYSNKLKPPSEGEHAPPAGGDKKDASGASSSGTTASPASPSPAPASGPTSSTPPASSPPTTNTSNK